MGRSFVSTALHGALLAGAAVVPAGFALADVKAGVDAWSRGDYKVAVREWNAAAETGDPDALFNLGQAHKLGRGVERDLTKAEMLFGRAAALGHLQASDNYGLLMFQRGEKARAMPYITAAAGRGDPRAQYLLGLAHFNGDNVPKDWVRAYALVSLAMQSGLPQANAALVEMDQHVPLEQRQQSMTLAAELAAQAQATRARQLASSDLGASGVPATPRGNRASMSSDASVAPPAISHLPAIASAEQAFATASSSARTVDTATQQNAGADYARPRAPVVTATPRQALPPATRPAVMDAPRAVSAAPAPAPRQATVAAANPRPVQVAPAPAAPAPRPVANQAAQGDWRVQLGAFGVPGNAQKLWDRVKTRPELAGHARLLVPAGRVNKLQAVGFASQSEAQAACSRLSAAGFDCIAVRD